MSSMMKMDFQSNSPKRRTKTSVSLKNHKEHLDSRVLSKGELKHFKNHILRILKIRLDRILNLN